MMHSKKIYTFNCKKCGKEYSLELSENNYNKGKYRKFCCRSCANSRSLTDEIKQKIKLSVQNLIEVHPEKFKHYKTYICKNCGKEFTTNNHRNTNSRIYCSEECKQQWLNNNWKPKIGGYRKGSGQGKSGWYKGIYCDSSWELAFVIYHLDNNLQISRCLERRKYIFDNKEHIYIPDFVTDEGIIEIKGYKTKQWEAKEKQNPDVKVLYKNDIKFYLEYVVQKYGNDYIKLYDNSNPKLNQNIYNQKFVWVSNPVTGERTMITPNKFEEYINNGWLKGRIKFNKDGALE